VSYKTSRLGTDDTTRFVEKIGEAHIETRNTMKWLPKRMFPPPKKHGAKLLPPQPVPLHPVSTGTEEDQADTTEQITTEQAPADPMEEIFALLTAANHLEEGNSEGSATQQQLQLQAASKVRKKRLAFKGSVVSLIVFSSGVDHRIVL
jgi:hypothetical protein